VAPWTWTVSSVGQIWRLLGLEYVHGKVSGTAIFENLISQNKTFYIQIKSGIFTGPTISIEPRKGSAILTQLTPITKPHGSNNPRIFKKLQIILQLRIHIGPCNL
jgi:hypothetical protein